MSETLTGRVQLEIEGLTCALRDADREEVEQARRCAGDGLFGLAGLHARRLAVQRLIDEASANPPS